MVPASFPACVNTLGWINEVQEWGKRSLNPELVFLLSEIRKGKERKGEPRENEPGRVPGWSREVEKFAERQKDH